MDAATVRHDAEVILEIEQVLLQEQDAVTLSNKLFAPSGLFSLLATTEAEPKILVESPLFDRAQDRLCELQLREATEFGKAHRMPDLPVPQVGLVTTFTPDMVDSLSRTVEQ